MSDFTPEERAAFVAELREMVDEAMEAEWLQIAFDTGDLYVTLKEFDYLTTQLAAANADRARLRDLNSAAFQRVEYPDGDVLRFCRACGWWEVWEHVSHADWRGDRVDGERCWLLPFLDTPPATVSQGDAPAPTTTPPEGA